MQTPPQQHFKRRRLLGLIAGGAATLPFISLTGCGDEKEAPPPELIKPEPAPEPAKVVAEPVEPEPAPEAAAAAEESASDTIATDLPRVDQTSQQAQQVAYVEDTSTIDASSGSRYVAGQQCGNCALYQGGDAEWGPCPLFQGKAVKKTGWCSAYSGSVS